MLFLAGNQFMRSGDPPCKGERCANTGCLDTKLIAPSIRDPERHQAGVLCLVEEKASNLADRGSWRGQERIVKETEPESMVVLTTKGLAAAED